MDDPWKHRSEGMKCKTCMWFAPKEVVPATFTVLDDFYYDPSISVPGDIVYKPSIYTITKPGMGRCRRHAPTINGYPVAFEDGWCGEHKPNEEGS